MVVAHPDCRMSKVTDEQVHADILAGSGVDTRSLDFGTILDQRATLAADVLKLRSSPFLPPDLPVIGCVYDIQTGSLTVAVDGADVG
jgi:carbonic anhydrase